MPAPRKALPAAPGRTARTDRRHIPPAVTLLDNRDDLIHLAEQLQALASELRSSQSGRPAFPVDDGAHGVGHANSGFQQASIAANLADHERPSADEALPSDGFNRQHFLALARARYHARRRRSVAFDGAELFGEPAWDILLDLYIAHAEGKPVSVSSACIGSAAPPTTGLRWLGVLQEAGLVERKQDPRDQRRVLVHLTGEGVLKMEAYFREALALEGVHAR